MIRPLRRLVCLLLGHKWHVWLYNPSIPYSYCERCDAAGINQGAK